MNPAMIMYTTDLGLLRHWQASFDEVNLVLTGAEWTTAGEHLIVLDRQYPDLPSWSDPIWRSRTRQHRILLIDTHPNDETGYAALLAGACAYCHAAAPKEVLQQVVAVVAAGEIWAGRSLVQRLLSAVNQLPRKPAPLSELSEREREVACVAARGLCNKDIARELGITERTVKAHLSACFEKLGVVDRVQLTLRVNGIQ